jgi:hypothetical protein
MTAENGRPVMHLLSGNRNIHEGIVVVMKYGFLLQFLRCQELVHNGVTA